MRYRLLPLAIALLAAGCGYRAGYTVRGDVQSIAVPIFANDTYYRNIEIGLTREVITAVEKRTPYRIVDSAAADVVLEGRISDYRTVVLQEDAHNEPTETELVLVVKVSLRRTSDGKTLYQGEVREGENFSPPIGETQEETRAFLFRRAAIRIVEAALDEEW
jgi:hypothetical protein